MSAPPPAGPPRAAEDNDSGVRNGTAWPQPAAVNICRFVLLVATALALGLTMVWDHGNFRSDEHDAVSGWAAMIHAFPKDSATVYFRLAPVLVLVLAVLSAALIRHRRTVAALQSAYLLVLAATSVSANVSVLDVPHDVLYHATGGGVALWVLAILSAGWLLLAFAPGLLTGGDPRYGR